MGEKEDRLMLKGLLGSIGDNLVLIVSKKELFRKELVHLLPGPLHEIELNLKEGMNQLDKVEYVYLEGVGLTRQQLQLKHDLYDKDLQTRVLGRFFKRANSLLGSLAKVVPILEPVLQYKEQVEGTVQDLDTTF